MRKKIMWFLLAILMTLNIFVIGCAYDRETGEIKINPAGYKKVEDTMQGGIGILGILAPLLGPVGGLATGAAAMGLGLVRKFKPQILAVKNEAQLSHTVASIAVQTLEELKIQNPTEWANLAGGVRKLCEDSGVDTVIVKNAIRGLRGMPALP